MTLTQRRRYLLLAFLVAFVLVLWVQLPHLLDPYAVEDDFRNLYWVHGYRDPNLFPHAQTDHLDKAAPGYAMLFRVGTIFVSPILFSKLLSFPLMLVAVYYVCRIVEQMAGRRPGLIAGAGFAVFNLAASSEISVTAGLQRSFAVPLLAGFAYYLMQQRHVVATAIIFLAGVIYIPVVPAMSIAYVFSCLRGGEGQWWRPTIRWRPIAYLLMTLFVVVLFLMPAFARQADRAFASSGVGGEGVHVLRDPTYASGGRRALFYYFPLVGRGGLISDPGSALQLGILGLLALAVSFVRRRSVYRLPPAVVQLLAGSFLAFVLAWTAIVVTSSFLLYIPSRHTQYALFLALVVYVFANVGETVRASALLLRRHRRKLVAIVAPLAMIVLPIFLLVPSLQAEPYQDQNWLPVARWLLLGLVVVLAFLTLHIVRQQRGETPAISSDAFQGPGRLGRYVLGLGVLALALLYIHVMSPSFYSPGWDEQQLFSYLETLPNDALLAGDPCTLDSVSLYAKRSVLFNCERYGDLPSETIREALSAYYAAEWEEVYAFCQQYGVSHLVVNAESYSDQVVQNGDYFFEPYVSQVGDTILGRQSYVLADIPVHVRLYQGGPYSVVSCQDAEDG